MSKLYRGRLLFSTCLSGAALAWGPGALAQDRDPNWQPRAEVDARAASGNSQVSMELFAPVAQNDANLLFVTGRIGKDERFARNGSVTIGGRGRIGEDVAIGANAGVDFYKSDVSQRDQAAVSFGLEGFTSVFDVRLNYRLPVTDRRTIGYLDPNARPVGELSVENNRLIERKHGWRLEDVPLGGANAELGATLPLGKTLDLRASAAGFDYRDDHASEAYRGIRGGLELGIDDPLGSGGRFSLGVELQDDNRWGTQARGTVRLSVPLGGGSRDRSAGNRGIDRQMGDRVRRDYVTPSGTSYTDLTSTSFAIDARTGNAFGGVYYVNGAAASAGAGTGTSPTTLGDAVARAGANGIVVAQGNAGTIASAGVTLAANQYLVGGAGAVDVRHANGAITTFAFGGTNGTIVGSNAGGAAVTLGQGSVVRDLTVRGAGSGILANGVGGFALQRVIVENTGGAGLELTNTTGAVVIDGIAIRGAGGAGLVVNGGSALVLRNSAIGGGAGAIDINDAGGNLTASLSNLTLSATGGTVLDIDGSGAGTVTVAGLSGIAIAGGNGESGGFAARNVTFDSSSATGIQAVDAGTMQLGTATARVNGAGVTLSEVDGALSFGSLNIANNAGTGLTVANPKSGTFTLSSATGSVDTSGGTALNLDPLRIDLTFSAVRSAGAAGSGVVLDNVQGAGTGGNALTIGALTITDSGQQGLYLTGGSTGLVTIGGGTIGNSGGASVHIGDAGVAGSGGTIGLIFGASILDGGPGPLVSIFNTGGAIRFTGPIAGAGPIAISDTLAGSIVSFQRPTTITGAASPAISLVNLAGSTSFSGPLGIINPAGTAIVIGAVPGGVTFGDVDITGLGGGTGLDLTHTSGNVIFGTLDISGTGGTGSTGIDLTNSNNAGAVTIARASTIQGVDIGVNLTNARMTGSFRYGDMNAANGLHSRIVANTVILAAGMISAHGAYDFTDVDLVGDTTNLTGGSFTSYYVLAGATGAGTATDPGSIAGAAASGAQYIVLLNDPTGGQDVIDTSGLTGGALNLLAGQTLVGFRNSDFFSVTGATVPVNLLVSSIGSTGITNMFAGSGAAILTSSLGASTVSLANDSRIDGVVISNGASGFGVAGAGVSNVVVRNSAISGNSGAISIADGGVATSVTLTNLDLSVRGGTALSLNGAGAGTLNVSGAGINIVATANGQGLVIDDVTVGALEIGSIVTGAAGGANGAVHLDRVAGGTLDLGSVTIGGASAGAGLTVANSSAAVTIGAVGVSSSAGAGVSLLNNSGNLALGAVSVSGSAGDGVQLVGNGSVSLGELTLANIGGAGLSAHNISGNASIAGATITGAAAGGVMIQGVSASGAIALGATRVTGGGTAILLNDIDGSVRFTGTVTTANANGIAFGPGSTGTIAFGDVDITGLGAGMTGVNARHASGGAIGFTTLDVTSTSSLGTRGMDLTGASFGGSFTVTGSSTISGTGIGVDLTNAAITNSFRYGDGSSADANGTSSTISAITPIAVGGINQAVGAYDFADVALIGDTTGLVTNPVSLFFAEQGRIGAGTKTDPGSLAAALASHATVIVLLNNPAGGSDTFDAAGLGGLTLDANQRLVGFLNGDSQNVGGGTPVNMRLHGMAAGIVTNPYFGSGAALLTNSGAGATVTLANGASVDGVRIGGIGIGISGIGASNVSISNSVIAGGAGAILLGDGAVAASATLTSLALSGTGGTVLDLVGTGGGSLSLRGSGISIAATGIARALAMDGVTLGADLGFTSVSALGSAGPGVSLNNVAGAGALRFTSIDVGGTTSQSGVSMTGNAAAISLGNVTVANTAGHGIEVDSNPGSVTLGTFAISDAGQDGLRVSGTPGSFTAAGGSITNSGASGIRIGDADGSVAFTGGVTVTNPGTTGITFEGGSTGTIAFADVDVLGVGAGRSGVDARLASGNISFATLDITGASAAGTRGIDLTGATFGGNLVVSGSSTIIGVGTGVDLANAAITGSFRFGDGSNVDGNGAGSTINATIPLTINGLNAASGTYDFADVNLVGDTSGLATSARLYWVLAGTGGSGTRGDPGSLAGAAASGADLVILLNNPAGGNDTLDANDPTFGTGGTFTLLAGQQLRGFLHGDTIALPGATPANVLLYNVATGTATNPFAGSGAPTLTTTAGAASTVVVGGNNALIDGVVIANGGMGAGVSGFGKSGVTIRNSDISGADRAITFNSGGLAASLALSGLNLWAANGSLALAVYTSGGGSITITQLNSVMVEGGHGGQGGANFTGATFDADLATAGYQPVDAVLQVGTGGTRVSGAGVDLSGSIGALNFTSLGVFNQGASGLRVTGSALDLTSTSGTIDTLNGATLSLSSARTALVLDRIVHAGAGEGVSITGLTGIGAGGRALQVATLTVTSSNTNAVSILGNVNGLVGFGTGSSIAGTASSAIFLSSGTGTLGFTYDGSVTQSTNAALLRVADHIGSITFGTGSSLTATNGAGLRFDNADGTYAFNGTTALSGGAGIEITNGSAGSLTFGAGTSITNATGAALNMASSSANLTYAGTLNQALGTALAVSAHAVGTIDLTGATLNVTGGTGLSFNDADGIYNLGAVMLSGGSRLALFGGSAGTFSFGNVDITGLLANTTAVDLRGATGNVSFATLDITGASATGTRGIDLTGATTGGNLIVAGSSQISGVGTGVDLTNAAITGSFRYGDGSSTDGNGAASTINAASPLVISGLNGAVGTYNFADVNMIGDTTNLSVSAYFVLAGASGVGTRSDPGSLAGAEASNATYIVLLNDPTGGSDILNATTDASGSFDLDGGQILYGFRNTDSFTVGGGAPANVVLYNVQTGVISNPFAGSGAPTLTASGANASLALGGNNVIDGVVIANAGTGAGVLGDGVGGTITIRNSTISGGAAGALRIFDNAANVAVGLSNLTLAANGGNILNLDGTGTGVFTLSQLAGLNALHTTETGGLVLTDLAFDSDPVAAGLQAVNAGALTLGTAASRISGDGLRLTNVTGALNFTDLNIANSGGTGLIVANSKTNNFVLGTTGGAVDTAGGTAINLDPLTVNMVLGSVRGSGGAYGILLDQVEGSFSVTGAVNVDGATAAAIAVRDNTAQADALDVRFGGAVAINNTAGAGVSLTNNAGATVEFIGGLGITTTTGSGFAATGGGAVSVTGSGNTISTGNAAALTLTGMTVAAGGMAFDQITAAPTVDTAVKAASLNLAGALNIRGLDLDAANMAVEFDNLTGAGGVNLTGTLDIDSGIGLSFAGTLGTINVANTAGSALTIDEAQHAIRFVGVTSGAANIATTAGTAAIAASTGTAIATSGDTGGALNYGGTVTLSAGSVLLAQNSLAGVTLAGAITSTTAGKAFDFVNADGAYAISGTVSHTGGAGVAIDAASAGSITFSGATKSFNTGASGAISAAGAATLAFTGGGLDIDTTSGTGFLASGGSVVVTGANNRIDTATGRVLSLSNLTAGSGGLNFASLTATGSVGTTAVSLTSVGGTSFEGGSVNIGGATGALSDGILVVNSSATIGFGATTIGAAGSNAIDLMGANGAVTFGTLNLAGAGQSTVQIGSSTNAVTMGTGTITAVGAANYAVAITGGTGSVVVSAALAGTNMVSINDHEAGPLTFAGSMSSTVGGISIADKNSGIVSFTGASLALGGTGTGVFLSGNTGGTIDFNPTTGGNGLDILTTGPGFVASSGGTVVVRGSGNSISTTGTGSAIDLQGVTIGANGFAFSSVSANGAATGISLNGVGTAGGGLSLGTVDLQGITGRGIRIAGANPVGLAINDLDIRLNGSSAVGLDFNGATLSASIAIDDFDVTNAIFAGTSIGVDLRGTLGGASIGLGGQSGASTAIAGVGTGVYLNASTNASFTYGDGEAATDTGSSITAGTAINATSAPLVGTYDFRDISFSGSPGAGFGVNQIYFVDSNGATGGGNGSGANSSNAMTLSAAELVAAAQDLIVLINNGSAISAAGSNGNDSLVLASGVQVRGFGDGVGGGAGSGSAPIVIALTVPSTILLSGGSSISIADPTGIGAATLTSAAGANVITLGANGNHLSGFVLDGTGGVARGIKDNGTGATNTLIERMSIGNFATQGIEIRPSTSTTIDRVVFSGNASDVLLNAANSVLTNITGTDGGISLENATGTTTLTNLNLTGGTGLAFANAAGTINATNVDITNAAITVVGGAAGFTFDSASSITKTNTGAALSIGGGHATGTFAFGGTLNVTDGTGLQFNDADGIYYFTGTTTLNGGDAGIDILNGSAGTFGFGSGTTIIHAAAGDAFVLANSNAGLTYSGSIIDNSGYAVRIDNHDAGTVTFDTGAIGSSGANALGLSVTNSSGGAIDFNGQTTLATGVNDAVTLAGNTSGTVTFNAAGTGLGITTTSGTAFSISGGGTINVLGANNSITTGSGTLIGVTNATTDGTTLNLNFADAQNTLGANGILVSRTAGTLTGSVNIQGGAITATDRGIDIDGGSVLLAYGGTIATSSAAARSVEITGISGGGATLTGNLTDTALGINISGNTGGQVGFQGKTISLTTVANANAVTLANNSGASIAFWPAAGGNGLDIVASGTGKGIDFTGGGTLTVSGSGNSIQTASGQILNLVNGTAGAGGIGFDTLSSTGSVAASAINISNLDGTATLAATTVSIAGTSGAASDGIFFGAGSAANVNLGAVTIANTGDEGIEINGAGNGTFTAGSVTINNTAGNGVEINGATNSVNLQSGAIGAVNDSTGYGVQVLNGSGTVTVGASVTKTTAGNVVFIDNHETGDITFSGNISATGGLNNGIVVQNVNSSTIAFQGSKTLTTGTSTAVSLLNNTGGTIAFVNGSLAIGTGSGAGFSATGGGTVSVEGTGNTIASGTGTALNIANTNIGANGLTFQSIASNGASSGIVLNNTGSSNGLRVTGMGTLGSGGTIQNSTGDGISLTNTENVRFAYMNLTNNLGDGIGGSGVNGFMIEHLTISGNGNDAGTDESGINIANLTGTGSTGTRPTGIFNSTIQNNNEFEVQISNSSGTLANFQVVNSTFVSNGLGINGNATSPHGNLFNFLGTGTASMGISVSGSAFTGNWNAASPPATVTGTGLFIDSSGTSMTAQVASSVFTNNNSGIGLSTGPGSTTLTYSIDGNTFTGSRSTAIADFQNGNGPFTRTVNGRITNNIIGNAALDSGSYVGNGISISSEGAINANYLISGNSIQQIRTSQGIAVNVGLVGQATGGGTTNVTILNNIIREITGNRAIAISNNQNIGTLPTIRVNLQGNTFASIAGQAGNGQYLRLASTGGGAVLVTQAEATAGAVGSEFDDANGFNDPTRINVSGTITWGQPVPAQPSPVVPLP